jgi:hypothetical protein
MYSNIENVDNLKRIEENNPITNALTFRTYRPDNSKYPMITLAILPSKGHYIIAASIKENEKDPWRKGAIPKQLFSELREMLEEVEMK